MPKPVRLIQDPKFNEWAYDILVNLTADQRGMLNSREIAKIRNGKEIKRFVNNAKIEEIEIILSKIGVECSRVFFFPQNFDAKLVKETYRQYTMKGKSVENIDEMLRQKVFVTHSKDIATGLAIMAMNCHSDVFMMNAEFMRVTKAAANIQLNTTGNINRRFNDHAQGYSLMAKIMAQTLMMDAHLEGKMTLQPVDMVILCLLAQHPNRYVGVSYLRRMTDHKYRPSVISKRCGHLFKVMRYIDQMPAKQDEPSYTISQKGILAIGEIANFILNQQTQ